MKYFEMVEPFRVDSGVALFWHKWFTRLSGSLTCEVRYRVFYFTIGTMAPRKKRKFYTSGNDLEAKRAREKKFIKKYIGLDLDDAPDIVEAVKGQGRNSIRLSK